MTDSIPPNTQWPHHWWHRHCMHQHTCRYFTSSVISTEMRTIHGYTMFVCNQPPRTTQPPTLNGMGNEYWQYSLDGKVTTGLAPHHQWRKLLGRAGHDLPIFCPMWDAAISSAPVLSPRNRWYNADTTAKTGCDGMGMC